jgi:hypothetical protein
MAPQIGRAIHINGRPNTGVTFGSALYTDATFYDAILELSGADLVDGGANDAAIRIGPNQPIDFSGNLTDPTQNNHTLRFINNDAGHHRLSYRDAVSELLSIADGGPVIIGDGTTGAILQLNAAVATGRQVQFMTNNALRWSFITGIGAGTEGGGNAGSNFTLMRYADDGSQLGSALTASRATGVVTLAVAPVLTTLPINAANDAAAAAAGVVIGGEYRNGSIKMIRVA